MSEWPFVAKEVFYSIIAGKSHEAEDEEDAKDNHSTDGHDHYGREILVVHSDFHFGISTLYQVTGCQGIMQYFHRLPKVNR